jgi:hypothetical protein
MVSVARGHKSEAPPVENARNQNDTTPVVAMGDGKKTTAVSSSSDKCDGTSNRRREVTAGGGKHAPVVDQAGGDNTAFNGPPSAKKGGDCRIAQVIKILYFDRQGLNTGRPFS